MNAQNEAANWYFGQYAGLDFNGGAPVPLTDGQLWTQEGCSTISDVNGNLLFYTDGVTIWNRAHNPMPNGMGLNGHTSSTQSGIIVPSPGNPDVYYVFTVDEGTETDGLQYSVVDMTLDGGLGDVTTKNILLETPLLEKLTAVVHANGNDIWVLAHRYPGNEYVAYLVTATGVSAAPVVSSIGLNATQPSHTVGYLKLSPDGRFLATASSSGNYLQLYNFDTATGIISNFLDLSSFYSTLAGTKITSVYGVEFSSDSSKLYVASTIVVNYPVLDNRLYQFDLTNFNALAIEASAVMLSSQPIQMGGLQLGIDGKIYVNQYEQTHLGVINNPNVAGIGANYVQNGVSLSGRLSRLGLPPFIQSYFVVGLLANNFCHGDATEFSVTTSGAVTSINWDFGDGNTSILEHPTHTYATPGTYTVSVTATTALETKTESKDITIYAVPTANTVSDFEVCSKNAFSEFDLSTKDTEVLGTQLATDYSIGYYPTLTDAQNGTNLLLNLYTNTNSTETIFARISNANNPSCFDTTSFDLIVKEAPVLNAVTDWVACDTDGDGFFDFDLTQKDNEVLNGQSATTFSVKYYLNQADANADINAIGPNYTNTVSPEQIFFRIENTTYPECFETGSFNLEVIAAVLALDPPDLEICDDDNDGIVSFDLSTQDAIILGTQNPSNFSVSYHTTQLDADNGSNSLNKTNYTNTTAYSETIYARVENNSNTNCFNTVSFSLRVYDSPLSQTVTDWQVCDDNNDGIQSFDLSQKDTEVLGSQSATQFNISYYLNQVDADGNINPITGIFQNNSSPQTVFYRIENIGNPSCFLTDSFDLEVFDTPIANVPTDMVLCDIHETGILSFDLSTKDIEILNGQDPNTFSVTYFSSDADAVANQNPLQKQDHSNSLPQEVIYARIQNNGLTDCYDTTSFSIILNPLPQPLLDETYVICPDTPQLDIDGGDFESWSWRDENGSELSTNRNINIVALGDYTLTVTETLNGAVCEKMVDFQVVSSGAPEDFTTEIKGFSDNVIIEVNVEGTGDFEYSVDGENFQNNNRIEVFPGAYTVYVRDAFLCRTLSKDIIALGYQKFFTPNGDGRHEFWNIIGAENYPESQLFIYDRQGKLLAQISPLDRGWNGTYNGLRLPSTDYWFRYVFDNGKVFTGHFTLKR
ncbi:T9SS type B sorting domain-containing protein [Maribacter algarum]|nr:T9SS type B sorting domain-containing protein [Maribacter algarum]